jgi:hypothetical protein
MRFLTVFAVMATVLAWSGLAYAGAEDVKLYSRTVEFQVVEPCDVVVMEGEATLEWNDCEGAYALFTSDVPGDHPLSVLVFTGMPDWSTLDPHVYQSFFCNKCCTKKKPDVYCMPQEVCRWYCYYTVVDWCCEPVCFYAYLPCNMALNIIDVY